VRDCESDTVFIGTEYFRTDTTKPLYVTRNEIFPRAMIDLIFTVVAVISPTVHGSLLITEHEYPLMHYTKLISEDHFTGGRPLVTVLLLTPLGGSTITRRLK
jgi:hypothetical protein